MVTVNGEQFIKLPAYDQGLVRCIAEGMVDKLPKNPTLSKCSGFAELVKLRNEQQADDLTPACKGAALFEESDIQGGKRVKMSAKDRRELRDTPTAVSVNVEGVIVPMVRPAHPCDDLCVMMKDTIIDHIVQFIRSKGITADTLESKRAYRTQELPKGIYGSKDGTYVVKLPTGDSGGHKYKRAKTLDSAIAALQVGADDPSQEAVNHEVEDGASDRDDDHSNE
jgi:hypothetical protein